MRRHRREPRGDLDAPLELAGSEIYVREGCYTCHSQMIRPMRDEVERYGHYSVAEDSALVLGWRGAAFEAHALDARRLQADEGARDLLMRLGVAFFAMMNVMLLSVAGCAA